MLLNTPKQYLSLISIVVILSFTIKKGFEYEQWNKQNLIQWDVISYYGYLPAHFIYHDLSFNFTDTIPASAKSKIWFSLTPDNKRYLKMTSGVAILISPFFLVAHEYSLKNGLVADGYSSVYEFTVFTAALFYFFLGLFFLRKTLLKFYSDQVASLVLFTVGLATNLFCFTMYESGMSHVYSFCLISIFLWLTIKWHEKQSLILSALIGLIGGLIFLVRPTNGLIFLIPFLWSVNGLSSFKTKLLLMKGRLIHLIVLILMVLIAVSPQLFYWKFATGHWLFYSYSDERFFFNKPHIIDGLFSFRNGFFIYTPIMLFILPGLWYSIKKNEPFSRAILFFFLVNIYVIFSWWCWWYGGSFGLRAMIDSYSVLALPLAGFYSRFFFKSLLRKIVLVLIIIAAITLNVFQTWQHSKTLLHYDGMNMNLYFKVFGSKKFPPDFETMLTPSDPEHAKLGLPERDCLDASMAHSRLLYNYKVAIKSPANGKFLSYDENVNEVVCNRGYAGAWETFSLERHIDNICLLKSFKDKFVGVEESINRKIIAKRDQPEKTEVFRIIDLGNNRFALKAFNGSYLTLKNQGEITIDADKIGPYETFELFTK